MDFVGTMEKEGVLNYIPKGQLISKCLFGAMVLTKKPTKFLRISVLVSKKRSNQKNEDFIILIRSYLTYLL